MEKLTLLDQKIAALKEKKILLQRREAETLYKELSAILKDNFSIPLVLTLVRETWKNSPLEQKETWLKASASFRASSSPKADKANAQSSSASQPTDGKKGTSHARP